jgi:hypothetical protein
VTVATRSLATTVQEEPAGHTVQIQAMPQIQHPEAPAALDRDPFPTRLIHLPPEVAYPEDQGAAAILAADLHGRHLEDMAAGAAVRRIGATEPHLHTGHQRKYQNNHEFH